MKTFTVSFVLTYLFAHTSFGQNAQFIRSGIIEYEKTIDMFGLIKKNLQEDHQPLQQQAFDQYKTIHSQFVKEKCTLLFSSSKSLFRPTEDYVPASFFSDLPFIKQSNIVFCDLESGQTVKQTTVFSDVFLLKDSLISIRWKITDERRDILGFHCRRANGLLLDSIYVVAFFTDEIQTSSGPESFHGLPGMILGVALPHEHITWFATNVQSHPEGIAHFAVPERGKITTYKNLVATVMTASKNWGVHANGYLRSFLF
jgi:GLPGLI family protein